MIKLISMLILILTVSCGEATFGSGASKKEKKKTYSSADINSDNEASATDNGTTVPDGAVSKGIFTIWTVPKDPMPEQDYHIYIKATGDITSKELEGDVTGTDSWYQTFSTDGSSSSSCDGSIPSVSDLFNDPLGGVDCAMFDFGLQTVSSTTTETVVKVLVPGAEFMVKDVVNVKVKEPSGATINEETLEIVF